MIIFRSRDKRFYLDTETRKLWSGDSGQAGVYLAHKQWEVLQYLAERSGTVVSKDQLLEEVWGAKGTNVNENSVDQAVSKIRTAVGDQVKPHVVVETIPSQGYRFVARIESSGDGHASPPPARHLLDLATVRPVEGTPIFGSSGELSEALRKSPKLVDQRAASPWAKLDEYLLGITNDFETLENVFTMLRVEQSRLSIHDGRPTPLLSLDRLVRTAKGPRSKLGVDLADFELAGGRWLIAGPPGSGKTTLLRMLALSAARRHRLGGGSAVPLLIDLGRFRPGALKDFRLAAEAFSHYSGSRVDPSEAVRVLAESPIIWYLDSYDETVIGSGPRDRTAWQEIEELTYRFPLHSFVVSARATHLPSNHFFEELHIQDFSDQDKADFVERYLRFFDSKASARDILDGIPVPAAPLARTPLLLSMMVSAFVSQGRIPDTLDGLYRLFVRQVLEGIEVSRPGHIIPYVKDLALSALAFEMLVSGQSRTRRSTAQETIASRLGKLAERGELSIRSSADVVLNELVYSGILVEHDNTVAFLHLTLLEYFASCEMNREYNFVAQTEMDQYFLRHPLRIQEMMQAAAIRPTDRVLELGAGIGSVARNIPRCKSLVLLELDKDLAKILSYQFPNADLIQGDALTNLPYLDFDVLISNLPFFLTRSILDILQAKSFRLAVMSIQEGEDLSPYDHHLAFYPVTVLYEEDFFPRQPFKSQVIKILPKRVHNARQGTSLNSNVVLED